MGRPSNTEQRRAEISSALIRVMSEHGYHGASIAKIAREASLASGLVLYHFESKQAILMHAVRTLVDQFECRYRSRLKRAGDVPRRQIHAFIDAQLALGHDSAPQAAAAWVVVAAQAVVNAEVREVYRASVDNRLRELQRLLRADYKGRGKKSQGVSRLAAAVISAIEGSLLLATAAEGSLPGGYAAPSVRAMVDGILDG